MRSDPPNGWRRITVAEVADVVGGGTPKTNNPENFGGAIPWITPKDLSQHQRRGIARGERNISQKGLDSSSARLLSAGTVLVSSRAPIGYCAIAENPVTTNQGFRSLMLKDRHSPAFFYYLIKTNRDLLESRASGSTFKEISGSTLKETKFAIPPPDEQRRIAWILGSLDDKIELNRRIAETLEQIAGAIFRARFVDFVGVEEFEESELGRIPKGWRVARLTGIAEVTMGQSPPSSTYSDDPSSGVVIVQGKGVFGKRFPRREVFCSDPSRIAEAGDLLMTVRAPVGDLNVARERTCLGRGVAGLSSAYPGFLEQLMAKTRERWREQESGTIYPSVTGKQVKELRIVLPPAEALEESESQVFAPIVGKQAAIYSELEQLTDLRDALLPKLISGEIRVPEGFGPDSDPSELAGDGATAPTTASGEDRTATSSTAAA